MFHPITDAMKAHPLLLIINKEASSHKVFVINLKIVHNLENFINFPMLKKLGRERESERKRLCMNIYSMN